MLELFDVLILPAPAQFDENATAQRGRRQLPADHGDSLGAKCRKYLGRVVVADTTQHTLSSGVPAVDDRAQRGLTVVGKDGVEFINGETRLPSFNSAVERASLTSTVLMHRGIRNESSPMIVDLPLSGSAELMFKIGLWVAISSCTQHSITQSAMARALSSVMMT